MQLIAKRCVLITCVVVSANWTSILALYFILNVSGCGGNGSGVAERTDHNLIQGTWEVRSAQINGETFPVEGQPDIHVGGRYHFDAGTLTKIPNPEFPGVNASGVQHRYRIEPTQNPKQIEIQMTEPGPTGPWPLEKAIYELENDVLRLCWSLDAQEPPPKKFQSETGDNQGLYVFQRVGT